MRCRQALDLARGGAQATDRRLTGRRFLPHKDALHAGVEQQVPRWSDLCAIPRRRRTIRWALSSAIPSARSPATSSTRRPTLDTDKDRARPPPATPSTNTLITPGARATRASSPRHRLGERTVLQRGEAFGPAIGKPAFVVDREGVCVASLVINDDRANLTLPEVPLCFFITLAAPVPTAASGDEQHGRRRRQSRSRMRGATFHALLLETAKPRTGPIG